MAVLSFLILSGYPSRINLWPSRKTKVSSLVARGADEGGFFKEFTKVLEKLGVDSVSSEGIEFSGTSDSEAFSLETSECSENSEFSEPSDSVSSDDSFLSDDSQLVDN